MRVGPTPVCERTYCCAMVMGYVVELVCSKQPPGSWMSCASDSVMLASGVGYTLMVARTLPGTRFAGSLNVCDSGLPGLRMPPKEIWAGNPLGLMDSLRVTVSR